VRAPGASPRRSATARVWLRLCRFSFPRTRPSRRHLDRFVAEHATAEPTLVVHSVDIDRQRHFPNAFTLTSRTGSRADAYTDASYTGLADLPDATYDVAVCTGLLEHLAEPERVVGELHRILRPGGRLIVSASAVFPFHGAPENYFHFTPYGFRHLFRAWSGFEVLRGSSSPYATLGILVERINLQCDVVPPVRLLNEVLMRMLPPLDAFVLRQHDTMARRDAGAVTDSVMPAALHAVVIR
jgi:SAM-dependent methyltransferase